MNAGRFLHRLASGTNARLHFQRNRERQDGLVLAQGRVYLFFCETLDLLLVIRAIETQVDQIISPKGKCTKAGECSQPALGIQCNQVLQEEVPLQNGMWLG